MKNQVFLFGFYFTSNEITFKIKHFLNQTISNTVILIKNKPEWIVYDIVMESEATTEYI